VRRSSRVRRIGVALGCDVAQSAASSDGAMLVLPDRCVTNVCSQTMRPLDYVSLGQRVPVLTIPFWGGGGGMAFIWENWGLEKIGRATGKQ
jgi:hypothetical protein